MIGGGVQGSMVHAALTEGRVLHAAVSEPMWRRIIELHAQRFGESTADARTRHPTLGGGLRRTAGRSPDERSDNLPRPLALILRDPLKGGGIVSIERDLHDKTAVARRLHDLHVHRIYLPELLVEVSGQRVGIGIRHDLSKIIRSAGVDSQPVMSSHVVGSIVSSITSVRSRPASLGPIRSLRSSRWRRLCFATAVSDHHVTIPDHLLGHQASMADAED